jgi:phosphatidylinositol phospholipase C delta
MITQTFGDMLFCPNDESLNNVPSPEELKYKIMISTKPPKEYLDSKSVRESSKQLQKSKSKDSDEDDEWGKEVNNVVDTQNEDNKVS